MNSQRRRRNAPITHEEIQAALAVFRREGRIITRLPDQVVPVDQGARSRWAEFDSDADGWVPAHEALI